MVVAAGTQRGADTDMQSNKAYHRRKRRRGLFRLRQTNGTGNGEEQRQVSKQRTGHFADKPNHQLGYLHTGKRLPGDHRVLQRRRHAQKNTGGGNDGNRHHQGFAEGMDLTGKLFHQDSPAVMTTG